MSKFTLINKLFFLIILALCTIPIYGQNRLTRFEHITQDQGLSSNSVLSLLQDKKGFLWVGTEFGLNRYDGYRFKIYQHPSISSNVVTSLCEDGNGTLWAGTADEGLLKYLADEDRFINVRVDKLKRSNGSPLYILYILKDIEDNLWITTPESLIKFDSKNNKSYSYFDGKYVSYLCLDGKSNFWVITSSYKEGFVLVNFDPKSENVLSTIPINGLSIAEFSSLAYHPNGNLYVGTSNGLYIINTISKEIVSHYNIFSNYLSKLPDNNVTCLYFLNEDILCLGTYNGGFAELNLKTQKIISYKHDPKDSESLIGNHISTIYKDRSEVLWIGDKVYGLNKLSPYKNFFHLYRYNPFNDNSISNNYIRGIFEDSKGFLWVATQFGGLNKLNLNSGHVTRYKNKTLDSFSLISTVWAVFEDSKGILWAGTSPNGLYTYDYEKDVFIKNNLLPNLAKETSVNTIYEDSFGNLLVGSTDGLFKINQNRDSATVLYNQYDPNTKSWEVGFDIQSIFEDSKKNIWVGTNDGILKFDSQTYQNPIIYRKELPFEKSNNVYINSFLESSDGIIWITTKGLGIINFNPKTNQFDYVNKNKEVTHVNTYGILSDAQGAFWISTDNGITRYNPKTNNTETFGITDGLQGKEFNRRAFFKSQSGEFFFGGVNGLNSFFPNRIIKNPNPPPIFITNVIASGKSLLVPTDSNRELELSYIDNNLTFTFAALDFNAPENNLYTYKLTGFDRDWIQIRNKNEVTYTNLIPGTYTFQIKGANNHQIWGLKTIELKIIIFPPPWLSNWAYLAYFLVIASAITITFRYYTNKLETKANIQAARLRAEKAEVEAKALERENQQRIETENQIKQKNIELEEANLKLKQLDELKAKFTAMLVHDLKSPLTVVNITLDLLSKNKLNNDKKMFLQTSQKNIQKIVNMVNEVLEFYQASSEDMKFDFEVVNPLEIITYCIEAAKISAANKNINVQLDIKNELKLISADANKLDRALNNLLSNAIKFTPKNGQISIDVWTKFDIETDLSLLYISIADTGEGIAAEELPYIFEPYRQAKSSNKKAGVGLGLATVKRIITAHNGNISVESELNKGTSFTISLPSLSTVASKSILHNQALEKKHTEVVASQSIENIKEESRKKILVVDDEIINQKIVSAKLRAMGYQVDIANNGEEAIKCVFSNRYDLILLDNYMPIMNGLEAAKEIRKLENNRHIPIIFFTADLTQNSNLNGIIDDVIEKPLISNKLEETIKLWLSKDRLSFSGKNINKI